MQDFRQLNVWEKSHQLTLAIYRATQSFPSGERFGLTSQLRRAAASIPSNIAESCGRGGGLDFARFLHVACGSASEGEYQLMLAGDLGLLSDGVRQELTQQVIEIKRMLTALIYRITSDN